MSVQNSILKSMFYGVVAVKRKINKPVFIKLDDKLFDLALHIYFNYGFDKLPYDIRPMLTNITSSVEFLGNVYYIVKTNMTAYVNSMPVEINAYPNVKSDDIFEVISCDLSQSETKKIADSITVDKTLAQMIVDKINADNLIFDDACKNECKNCSCIKQKIKNDVERNLEGVYYG